MKLTEDSESERASEQVVDREITVHNSSPDRVIFTEKDNTDGWISTDYTVDLLR